MKKPLLFCLLLWVVLFALPWTRGRAVLDWRGATFEQFSGTDPAWAPLDKPYLPEKENVFYNPSGTLVEGADDVPDDVRVEELRVAPQFASLARGATERDVLLWCAFSATNSKNVAHNMGVLERRFPGDAAILALTCGAQIKDLSMTTRVPGPLSSPYPSWSVQIKPTQSTPYPFKVDFRVRPQWDVVVAKARKGQRMEPRNGFWWWLETMALLGARRDEAVWSVLKVGSSKTEFDDHGKDRLRALRRAHIQTQGVVPVAFLVRGADSFVFYSRWREATRQVCENVMGARLVGRHKTAVEGGRDMVMMGRLLRRSGDDIGVLVATAIEAIALRNTVPPAALTFKRLPANANSKALLAQSSTLLGYASALNRKDIVSQLSNEMSAMSKARQAVTATTRRAVSGASGISLTEGIRDSTVSWAAGLYNTGALLVQTLPLAIIVLALLSLLSLARRRRQEAFPLPVWTRGLGWSAFGMVTLLAAQVLFNHIAWQHMLAGVGYWGFDFILPRLVDLLPLWVFVLAAYVAAVGAVWATVVAARRTRGDASVVVGLRQMLSAPDERMGALNLSPLLQLIAVVGTWGLFIAALGAWFYFPQKDAFSDPSAETLHDQYSGLSLMLLGIVAVLPAVFFRAGEWRMGSYFWGWVEVARRFLVAHLVLTSVLYLLIALSGSYWAARFDAEWLQENSSKNGTGKV